VSRSIVSIAGIAVFLSMLIACPGQNERDDEQQFRPNIIYCGEAQARLTKCCPGFEPKRTRCTYYYENDDQGCAAVELA